MSPARVLFVDDEPRVLEAMQRMLFPHRAWLHCDVAQGARHALRRLEEDAFDLVITDMRMPEMDGASLLEQVAEKWPGVIRLVLTGHSELDTALRAVKLAHGFIAKPVQREELLQTIESALALRELTEDTRLRAFVSRIGDLPTQPALYAKLTRVMEHEGGSLRDVAELVAHDVGIATKLLQVANSAYFSRGIEVSSIERAVPRLGFEVVRAIVLAAETSQAFGLVRAARVAAISRHSYEVAMLARALAPSRAVAELAFTAGLLHDVGHLAILSAAERRRSLSTPESQEQRPTGGGDCAVTHSDVGAYLLALWGIPYPVIDAVAFHHVVPPVASGGIADCVRVAEHVLEWRGSWIQLLGECDAGSWRAYRPMLERAIELRTEGLG